MQSITKNLAVVGAAVLGLSFNAMAAVPESVTTGLAESKTDALAVGALVIGIVIAIAGFKYIKRALS